MKTVIIGGTAGGAACAARLRRLDEQAEITMIEKGAAVSSALCGIPYYLGGVIADRNALFAASTALFEKRFNVRVMTLSEAVHIDRNRQIVRVKYTQGGFMDVPYDNLILSPGASPIMPSFLRKIKGVFTLRTIADADAVKSYIAEHKVTKALVAGAGFVGLECAENLARLGLEVELLDKDQQVLRQLDCDMASYLHAELGKVGIKLSLGHSLVAAAADDDKITLELDDGSTRSAQMVIVALGIKPNSDLANECGLQVTAHGAIQVDRHMRTSDPHIFALGDAVEVTEPLLHIRRQVALAGPAVKQARVLCANIVAQEQNNRHISTASLQYNGSKGTNVIKVGDLTAASVGLNESALRDQGIAYEAVWTHGLNHAGYYPGAKLVHFKLIYERGSGIVLGAQAVGPDAEKFIEVVGMLMSEDGTVYDLANHEQAYAPPFSSVRDITNIAGSVACNIEDGLLRQARFDELKTKFKDAFLLDVRTKAEYDAAHLDGFVNIDLNDLRHNLRNLPQDQPIVVTCRVGLRGYVACRILSGHGFKQVYNLSGGVLTAFAALRQ